MARAWGAAVNHRPTRDTVLPTFAVILASSWAPPTPSEWVGAGQVEAPDAADAAWQLSRHIGCPLVCWVRGPDGRTTRCEVETQGSGGVGR